MTVALLDGDAWVDKSGYLRHGADKYVHVTVAEQALGKPMPQGAVVHHVDGDKKNNEPSNLVICPNQRYHMMLHTRAAWIEDGINPNTERRCSGCKQTLLKDKFPRNAAKWDGRHHACRECSNAARRGKQYSTNRRRRLACQ